MTKSVASGIGSVLSILLLSYTFSLPNGAYSFWIQLAVMILVVVPLYRYLSDGFGKITSLRNMEKLVSAIERCDTFDQLAKTFEL